jgi:hypothetical protein
MLCYFPSNFDYRPFTKVIFPEFTVSWQFHSGAPPIPGKPKVSDPYELSPNKKEFSDRESMLYTIGVGAFTALLSAGPGIYDNHPFIGGAFTLAGLAGLIGLMRSAPSFWTTLRKRHWITPKRPWQSLTS